MTMLSRYFSTDELACKCGCGLGMCTEDFSPELLRLADATRDLYGGPLRATSGARCAKHNADEGGSPTSSHMPDEHGRCLAIDFNAPTATDRYRIVKAAMGAGFARIVQEAGCIHCDVDLDRKPFPVLGFWQREQ